MVGASRVVDEEVVVPRETVKKDRQMAVKIGVHVNDGPVGRVQQTVVRESRLEQVEQIGHETDVAGRISGYFDVHVRQRPQWIGYNVLDSPEGFFGRTRQEFFHKRSFAGVTMDEIINMLDDYMVWYRDKRIKTESGHEHHGASTRARSCGMIGGDGINDESDKTTPPPNTQDAVRTNRAEPRYS